MHPDPVGTGVRRARERVDRHPQGERGGLPGLEVADDTTSGVLELSLRAGRYDWRFLPIAGRTFTDAGSQACH